MKNIKVLGTGCANCKTTLKLIEEMAKEKGAEIQLEKIEDIQAIMGYGVISTPGGGTGWQGGTCRWCAQPRQDRRLAVSIMPAGNILNTVFNAREFFHG